MSTRCQIEFKYSYEYNKDGEKKKQTDVRTMYRHSDGYPEEVLKDLSEFLVWNKGRNSDIEYTAANFIYWSKRKDYDMYERMFAKKPEYRIRDGEVGAWDDIKAHEESQHRGYGISAKNEFHGDIEWFYTVTLTDPKVVTIEVFDVASYPMEGRKSLKKKDTILINVEEEQKRLQNCKESDNADT